MLPQLQVRSPPLDSGAISVAEVNSRVRKLEQSVGHPVWLAPTWPLRLDVGDTQTISHPSGPPIFLWPAVAPNGAGIYMQPDMQLQVHMPSTDFTCTSLKSHMRLRLVWL